MHLITEVQPKPIFLLVHSLGILDLDIVGERCFLVASGDFSILTSRYENSEKRILQKSHSDSTITEMATYFHGLNNLEWKSMDHQFPENKNSFYTRVPGMIKMGLVKLEQDGHFQLHWHKGTE